MKGKELVRKIREVFPPKQAEVLEELFDFLDELVKVHDFNELKGIVAELAEAQKETKEELKALAQAQKRTEERLEELAEAQKRTEEELKALAQAQKRTEERLEELAEAQKETEEELKALAQAQKRTEERLEELAEAQKRTEEELKALAQAQKRTEERLEELAQAQKKTEEELRLLTKEVKKIKVDLENVKDHLGALSNTVGYTLENEAYKYLPSLLKKNYQIEVVEELKRTFLEIAPEKFIEINIIGKARKNGKDFVIVGEGKVQPKISHVNEFLKKIEKIKEKIDGEIFPVLVCHQIHPKVEKYCKEKGITVFLSYQLK